VAADPSSTRRKRDEGSSRRGGGSRPGKESAPPAIRVLDAELFEIAGIRFRWVSSDYGSWHTSAKEVIVLKPASWFEYYAGIIRERGVRNVVELGIFEGGSVIALALLFDELRIAAFDLRQPDAPVLDFLDRLGIADRVKLFYGVYQDDRKVVEKAVFDVFGGAPIDMVVDDASHQYAPTRASFEILFPLLRYAGVYIIEDWAWAHWPGAFQTEQWIDQPAMSNLIFELTMLTGSGHVPIEKIDVRTSTAAVYKSAAGPLLNFRLNGAFPMRGKALSLI
jgi:predicted O-methyltransferase YrrM